MPDPNPFEGRLGAENAPGAVRPRRLPLVLALVLGTGLSIGLSVLVGRWERLELQAEFDRRVDVPKTALVRDIDDYLHLLQSIGAFYFSSQQVDRREFQGFIQEALGKLNGFEAVEWLPRVAHAGRARHEQSVQAEGLGNYRITEIDTEGRAAPAEPRAEYYPIQFVVPLEENRAWLGLDLSASGGFAEYMVRARESNALAASKPTLLRRGTNNLPAYRFFFPVFTNGVPHDTPEERRANLGGFASAVVSVPDLAQGALARVRLADIRGLTFHLADVTDRQSPVTLFETREWSTRPRAARAMQAELSIDVAGRRWLLHCQPTAAYLARHRQWQQWAVLLSGMLITLLLGAYLWSASGRSARVERLVVERTAQLARANEELEQKIRERERAEEALNQQRHLVDTLMDSLPDHIYFKDEQSRFLRVNRAMSREFKLAGQEEAVGMTDFDFFSREHAERARADEEEILKTGNPLINREEKETWPDGSVTWVSTTKQALYDKDGELIGTFGLSRDITARKRAEEELARKAEELSRSNRELEQFAYVASHDLQEPLRMIASFTQLLERRYRDQLDAEAQEYIQFAVGGALRLQVLINDLLAYSRVGTRGKPLAPTDLNESLHRALNHLKIAIEEAGAEVTSDPLPTVSGDIVQLTQLFQNLVGNAIKFRGSEPPRVQVSARLQPVPEAELKDAAAPREEWAVSVSDNGIGIEPQYFERIFVIFQRLHTREQYPGTGIGLAVCKKIVERHGGRIQVESRPGKGSTFTFTFPHSGSAPL